MTYNLNGKVIAIPDAEIEKLMKTLDITREEAIDTWLFDNDYVDNEEADGMTEKAKQIRRYEKSDKPRKKTVKERKIDEAKKTIFDFIVDKLANLEGLADMVTKNEAEISFNFGGDAYTIKLIKHRKK